MPQIRLLILSDIHGDWPYSPNNPAPKANVLLHCRDLTQVGGLPSFMRVIEDIKTVGAELKLVIAGNHDLELDKQWVRDNMENGEDLNDHIECVSYMKGLQSEGRYYLVEGTHSFELSNGRESSVYANPYTLAFNGYAFAYSAEEDRFNYSTNSVPENVDIAMTHSHPLLTRHRKNSLDVGHEGTNCGYEKLAAAWKDKKSDTRLDSHVVEVLHDDGTDLEVKKEKEGIETLFINAAMYGQWKSWLVDYGT